MRHIIHEERIPLYDDKGKLMGHQLVTDSVEHPPSSRQQLRTAAATIPTPTPKPTPVVPAPTAPVVYWSTRLRRHITDTHCLHCDKTLRACECWPPYDASAVQPAVPATRQTFEEVVKLQRASGVLPTSPTTLTTATATPAMCKECGKARCNCPPPPLETFAEVVKTKQAQGML